MYSLSHENVLNMNYPAQKEILCSLCKLSKLKLILISETFQRTFPEKTGWKAMLYEYFSKLQIFTSLQEKDTHCAQKYLFRNTTQNLLKALGLSQVLKIC